MKAPFDYKTEPYRHQVDAFNKLYGKPFGALFMEQGTGKSKVAIDIASNLFKEGKINAVLLIAPNGVQRQWATEQIPIHSPVRTYVYVWNNSGSKIRTRIREEFLYDESESLKWFCTNIDVFSTKNHLKVFREYVYNHKCMVIIDEATRIKNPGANRTTNILYNLGKIQKHGRRVVGVEPYSSYRLILTGMMVTNSPYDLWSMFEFLKHDYFQSNYYAFRAHYGIEVKDTHPGTGRLFNRMMRYDEMQSILKYHEKGRSVEQIAYIMSTTESNVQAILKRPNMAVPYKNLEELRGAIQPDSFIIRKDQCLDLPPKIYERIEVDLNSEQKRIYKELVKEFLSIYDEKELTVNNKVTLIGRLQQITGGFFPYKTEDGRAKVTMITKTNPKLEALKADLDETGSEVIIVWARFVAELKMIHEQLTKSHPEKRIALYYGGTWAENREAIINDFKEGKVDVLVANARTAGIGLNLQKSHNQYFYSNSFSLEDRLQAEDRSHRSGQQYPVLYKDIIIRNTVDEKVHQVLTAKKNLLDYFRDTTLEDMIGG